jgi:hypothetical protein
LGSLELRHREGTEFIGQPIDYSDKRTVVLRTITLDSLDFARIDLIKIDVEGMELEAIEGAEASLTRSRPVLIVESIKTDKAKLRAAIERLGYRVFEMGLNLLAVHESDNTLTHVKAS